MQLQSSISNIDILKLEIETPKPETTETLINPVTPVITTTKIKVNLNSTILNEQALYRIKKMNRYYL
jgi:hypothetical protein